MKVLRRFLPLLLFLFPAISTAQNDPSHVASELALQKVDKQVKSGKIKCQIRYSVTAYAIPPESLKFSIGSPEEKALLARDRIVNVDTILHSYFLDGDNWRSVSAQGLPQSCQEGYNVVLNGSIVSVYQRQKDAEIADYSVIYGLSLTMGHGFSQLKNKTFQNSNGQTILMGDAPLDFKIKVRAVFQKGNFNYPVEAEYSFVGSKFVRRWRYSPHPSANSLYPESVHVEAVNSGKVTQSADYVIQEAETDKPADSDVKIKWFAPTIKVQEARLKGPVTYTYAELLRWNRGKDTMTLDELLEISRRKLKGETAPELQSQGYSGYGAWAAVIIPLIVCALCIGAIVALKRRGQ